MSNLNVRQFSEQLPMFMPIKDIIDNVHKVDSVYSPIDPFRHQPRHSPVWSPRDQWEKRQAIGVSLREDKLNDLRREPGRNELADAVRRGESRPLSIFHDDKHGLKTLADGHHRLALHQEAGHQEIAVEHRDEPVWGSSQADEYEEPPLPDFVKVSKRRSSRS